MIRLALQTWDDLIAPDFQETISLSSDIEIGFSDSFDGFAQAYFPSEGTVWLNNDWNFGENNLVAAEPGSYGFNTYVHELGHALGLDHMGDYNGSAGEPESYQDSAVWSVMSYFSPSGYLPADVASADWAVGLATYDPQTPMLADVLAVQSMYGASTTTRTGDTVYGFNCNVTGTMQAIYDFSAAFNTHPIVTIWDSAGRDTLDLSGWSGNLSISLVPGTFSSGNAMSNNIAIAFGCIIENAAGGAGNDGITGNSAANVLQGAAGNDRLAGGGGNDTLAGGEGNDTAVFEAPFASYTVNFNASTSSWTIASAATGTDSVSSVEFFQFSDGLRTAAQLSPASELAVISGTNGNDSLTGTSAAEILRGLGGNDTLRGNGGNDQLEGAAGLDTAVLAGSRNDYQVVVTGSTTTITALVGTEGSDTATGVERLRFADKSVAFDIAGNAGAVAKILGAVLGPDAVQNETYVGMGLAAMDGGMSYEALMQAALDAVLGPGATHAQVVTTLYTNVAGFAPGAAELAVFTGLLAGGIYTPASLGVAAADTALNAERIGLTGLAPTGLEYV